MRSKTILRDMTDFARASFTVLLLSILLLVTGCGSSADYTPRTELAPPPPFMVASRGGQEMFGPAVPVEMALHLALLQTVENIEPAAGDEMTADERPVACRTRVGFSPSESHMSFGDNQRFVHENDLSFARLHSGHDSAEMVVRMNFALPVARKIGCR